MADSHHLHIPSSTLIAAHQYRREGVFMALCAPVVFLSSWPYQSGKRSGAARCSVSRYSLSFLRATIANRHFTAPCWVRVPLWQRREERCVPSRVGYRTLDTPCRTAPFIVSFHFPKAYWPIIISVQSACWGVRAFSKCYCELAFYEVLYMRRTIRNRI